MERECQEQSGYSIELEKDNHGISLALLIADPRREGRAVWMDEQKLLKIPEVAAYSPKGK